MRTELLLRIGATATLPVSRSGYSATAPSVGHVAGSSVDVFVHTRRCDGLTTSYDDTDPYALLLLHKSRLLLRLDFASACV